MVPLPLTELSLQRPLPKATIPAGSCTRCQAKVACAAPLPEEVPEPLRNLSAESCQALAPLELDVGPEIRAAHNSGYRLHATIIRFAWKALSVKQQIKQIENKEERAKAKAARKFLLEKEDCSYRKFVEDHDKFLGKHPGADDRKRRRRLQFIETPGLETALWPHLFYLDSLCLTTVRSTDIRRRGSSYGPSLEALLDAQVGDADSEDEDAEDGQRHSTKRAYAALALSARIGYGSSYEFLHFAYDLNLWSALGAKKKTSTEYDILMRVLMKGHSFSPLYWKAVHWALLDMVRQMGYPKVFWTISPYEWSAVPRLAVGRNGQGTTWPPAPRGGRKPPCHPCADPSRERPSRRSHRQQDKRCLGTAFASSQRRGWQGQQIGNDIRRITVVLNV